MVKLIHKVRQWYRYHSAQNAFITERMCANNSMWGV